jgi:D-alanyl-D-alanine dipeptidase
MKLFQKKFLLISLLAGLIIPTQFVFAAECWCGLKNTDCSVITLTGSGCESDCKTTYKENFDKILSGSVGTESACTIKHNAFLAKEADEKKAAAATTTTPSTPPKSSITPTLNIEIPGLTFSPAVISASTVKSNFLADYINAIYLFLIGTGIVFVIIMVMIGGLQYTIGAGSEAQIGKGKERIRNAITGLVLLLCTFLILKVTNPQLVTMKMVELQSVAGEDITYDFDSDDSTDESGAPSIIAGGLKWCDTKDPNFVNMDTLCEGNKCPGIKNVRKNGVENYLRKDTAQALVNAGKIANQQGYYLSVRSKCRTLETQIALAKSSPSGAAAGVIAKPGGSPHSFGVAIDLVLMSGGKSISDGAMSGEIMCKQSSEGVSQLSQIMFKAGFVRLGIENWHFEYPAAKSFCRKKAFTGLADCAQCIEYDPVKKDSKGKPVCNKRHKPVCPS